MLDKVGLRRLFKPDNFSFLRCKRFPRSKVIGQTFGTIYVGNVHYEGHFDVLDDNSNKIIFGQEFIENVIKNES